VEQQAVESINRELLARAKSCGKGVVLGGPVSITGIEKCEFGNNVHIGINAFIRAQGGLKIGDNTHISRNLLLYTVNHRHSGDRLPYDEELIKKEVVIGKNVWVGMNVCIAPGTTIGDGAIIGMGTVVSGSIPPLSIVGNAQWRIIGWRDKEHYETCDATKAYGGPNGIPFFLDDADGVD
jgi:maltose O-acetyltransferase